MQFDMYICEDFLALSTKCLNNNITTPSLVIVIIIYKEIIKGFIVEM